MDLKATQRLLAELSTDDALRQRFAVAPETVAEEFGFDPDVARQLAGLSVAQVTGFACCLHRKRLNEMRRMLPATCRALGSRLAHLFELHAARLKPQGAGRHVDDAVAFSSFLSHWSSPHGTKLTLDDRSSITATGCGGPTGVAPGIADLASYEVHWLRFLKGRIWPLLAIFRSDPREAMTGRSSELCDNRWLLACWFRLRGRPRHVAIRLPRIW
jgi:hypothetical protein